MNAKRDIGNKEDIVLLINAFYDRVKADDVIGHIFNRIIGDDWSEHLPIMYQFWETVLFAKAGYTGNPVKKHIDIDRKIQLQPEHFQRWLSLWNVTVDSLYAGEVANDAKSRANNMVHLISMKVNMARDGKSLM
jgi:hemoglobin